MELQPGALLTPPAGTGKRTLAPITFPDRAPDLGGNVAAGRSGRPPASPAAIYGKLLSFRILHEQRQGAIEEKGRVAVRNRVTEQRPRTLELVHCFLRDD